MVAFFLSAVFLLSCTPTALLDFAVPKWKAAKNVRIEDAYKWLYQATRGGEHAAPDRASAKKWLEGEWEGLDKPMAGEPLWEPLCRDGSIGRLHLRPYKATGGKMDDVLDAFLAGSREYKEAGTSFVDAWTLLGRRLKEGSIGSLRYKDWTRLDLSMKAKSYPAVHHSSEYALAQRPSYRLITQVEYLRLEAMLHP